MTNVNNWTIGQARLSSVGDIVYDDSDKATEYTDLAVDTFNDYKEKFESGELTTDEFLDYFGLSSKEELPEIDILENTESEEKDLFESIKNWALQVTKDAMQLDEAFCNSFLESILQFENKLPRQCIHRDPNPGNIIVSGKEWGFIDFELSEKNIRIFDPCYAATAVLSETYQKGKRDEWFGVYQDIISGYNRTAHLTEEEKKALPYVVLGNQMICIAWFSGDEKFKELFEINSQMFRYLLNNKEKLQIQ